MPNVNHILIIRKQHEAVVVSRNGLQKIRPLELEASATFYLDGASRLQFHHNSIRGGDLAPQTIHMELEIK